MTPIKRSLYSLHTAVLLFGGTALFSQIIPIPAVDITLGRCIFASAGLFLFVKFIGESILLANIKDYLVAAMLGGIICAHWATYFASMQYAGVSVGIISLFTFPVITVLIEPLFEKTRILWQDVVSAVVVLIGIVLIVPESDLSNNVTMGVTVGIISAFFYAIRNLLHRKLFTHYSGPKAMAWQTFFACIALIPFVPESLISATSHTWLLLFILGTAFTALPHALVATSLIHLRAKTFSLIACMQPFYGVVFAIILLQQYPSWETIIGGILVTSASIYETVNTHRKSKK